METVILSDYKNNLKKMGDVEASAETSTDNPIDKSADKSADKSYIEKRELPKGTVVGSRYEVLRVAGRGGISVVYQVNDTHLNKNWALKETRKDGRINFEMVRQDLMAETELLKRLSHPYLPRIVDIIANDSAFYVVMDFFEGQTLKDVLDKHGAQSQEDVVTWGIKMCEVLTYLHTRKPPIIYRDMKPSNIMLKPDGSIVLFDFSCAREFRENKLEDTICLGTVCYAAPEQYGGMGQTDVRTDIYSLGATLFNLLTGETPRPGNIESIRKFNPSLSRRLEKIILKCTKAEPTQRYQTCAELMHDLEKCRHNSKKNRIKRKSRFGGWMLRCFSILPKSKRTKLDGKNAVDTRV